MPEERWTQKQPCKTESLNSKEVLRANELIVKSYDTDNCTYNKLLCFPLTFPMRFLLKNQVRQRGNWDDSKHLAGDYASSGHPLETSLVEPEHLSETFLRFFCTATRTLASSDRWRDRMRVASSNKGYLGRRVNNATSNEIERAG